MDITSSIDSIIVESKKEPDVSKLSINKTTDSNKVLKPSNDSAKQKDYKQKENIKDSINHQKGKFLILNSHQHRNQLSSVKLIRIKG